MSHRMLVAALALASIALCATAAYAAFPISPNVPNPLPGATTSVVGCTDGAGGAFVVAMGYGIGQQVRVYRQGPNGGPIGSWPASGIVLADTSGNRGDAVIAPDGSGGVFVAWEDGRNPATSYDIFVQHVTAAGAIAAGWPARGIPLTSAANMEYFPQIVGDGVGGALVVWGFLYSGSDWDVYGARVSGAGAVLWNRGILTSVQYETSPQPVLTGGQLGIAYQYKTNLGGATIDIKMVFHNLSDGSFSFARDICTAVNDQYLYGIVAGSGDLYYVVWRDGRTANYTVYAECMQGSSQVSVSGWPFNDGLPVADGGGPQGSVVAVVDAQNDLWTAISDSRYGSLDVFVQRLTIAGIAAPGWPAAGLAVCTAADMQTPLGIDLDGAQEAVVIWTDRRSGSGLENDVYGTRIRPDGLTAPGFAYDGQPLATEVGAQQSPGFVVGDPAGGAYVAWSDGYGEFQHLDRFGALGDVAPHLTSVRDVAGDQGGAVRVQWSASPYDAEPLASIASYWVWRSTPTAVAQAAVARGGRWAGEDATDKTPVPGQRLFRADAAGYAWEYLASQPASLLSAYSYVAPTVSDSTPGHDPYTAFMVEARSVTSGVFWSSPADSGHSVDNLAPQAPAPFAGIFAAGTSVLVWGAPADGDLAGYVLHRGLSASFVPGPATLIASLTGLSYTDPAGAPYYYKVAAMDVHGNIGPYATVLPTGALAVGEGGLPTRLGLAIAGANPVRTTTCALRLELPQAAHVSLSLFDVGGRRVRTLLDGAWPAGRHLITWDGRGDGGAMLPAGLYLARLDADGQSLVQRIARLR